MIKKFILIEEKLNWNDSIIKCKNLSGRLATKEEAMMLCQSLEIKPLTEYNRFIWTSSESPSHATAYIYSVNESRDFLGIKDAKCNSICIFE